jgi:uncharacterized repeat protein (TIGR01451 family)
MTFTATVTDNGTDAATGVSATIAVPAGATLVSASTSVGTCTTAAGTTTCTIGTLAAHGTATLTLVYTATQSGTFSVTASTHSDHDTNSANDSSSASVTVLSATAPPPPPPPSSAPGTFNAAGNGIVLVNGVPVVADQVFVLHSGDVVDVTNGTITFTGSDGSYVSVSGQQFTARRTLGRAVTTAPTLPAQFRVTQPATTGALTDLTLTGGDFSTCTAKRSLAADKTPVRQLWASAKGNFRTTARYSSATVRGTVWLTQDRCDGTLVQVVVDTVDVFDFGLNKTIPVGPGQSYLALPAQPKPFTPPVLTQRPRQTATQVRKNGLLWSGHRFATRAAFTKYLNSKGATWHAFQHAYPKIAAALDQRQARRIATPQRAPEPPRY